MSVLPAQRHSVLVIHADAVTTRVLALQQFKPIPAGIVRSSAGSRVDQSQLR
jgi:hypothetical protein